MSSRIIRCSIKQIANWGKGILCHEHAGQPSRAPGRQLAVLAAGHAAWPGSISSPAAFREMAMSDETVQRPFRHHLKREASQARAYSQAVITEGGRTVWLAGQVGAADGSGSSLAGDFDGQVREVFSRLNQTLEEAGGSLADMVTMTVFITDARYGDRFTELRKEIFGDNFPASALITVAGLARPEILVEVQGIAVIG